MHSFLITSLVTTLLSLLKLAGTDFILSRSILSTSAFKFDKFDLNANLDVYQFLLHFFKSAFVAWYNKSILTLMSPPKGSCGLVKYWIDFYIFISQCLFDQSSH